MTCSVQLREVDPVDEELLAAVLDLNQHWVPHVGTLTHQRLAALVSQASLALAAFGVADLEGFVIAMAPGADYSSPNYRWFERRHEDFTYIDRIAIDPRAQGRGLGRALYDAAADHGRAAGSGVLCAEVNVDPPNPRSQAFHARMGFVEVGRQWTYGHTVEVQMLEKAL